MGPFSGLFEYLRIYRRYIGRRIYIVFALTALGALAEGLGITLILPLLRASETGGQEAPTGRLEQTLFDGLEWFGAADSMLGILTFIGIAFAGKALALFVKDSYQGYLQAQLYRELKSRLFIGYSEMDYRYFISRNTGHFINVINAQVSRFFNSFKSFAGLFSAIITTTSYLGIALLLTWRFALMAIALGILILYLFKRLNSYVRDLSRLTSEEGSQLNKLLVQALQAFKYIVATNQVKHLSDGVMASIERYAGYTFRQSVAGAFTTSIKEPLSILFILGIIGVQIAVFGEPVAPIFVSILLFHRGMQSIIGIQSGWQNVMNQVGGVEMVHDEIKRLSSKKEYSGSHHIDNLDRSIVIDDVHFAYDTDEEYVLKSVNIEVRANTTIALVGESGAGKSTLVDLFTLMLRPQSGEVRIDDVPGTDIDLSSWRSQIGYVSQETVIFDDTISNNISLWKEGEGVDARVKDAAQRAHAHHFIRDLPNGYDTVVGDRGVRLSGGQKQRLFVARELFKQPNLLILDEATSALDTESERYIQKSIDALKGQITVIIIAHRLSTIKNVDRVYVMDEGRVVEQGTYEELRNHERSRFSEMVKMQSL